MHKQAVIFRESMCGNPVRDQMWSSPETGSCSCWRYWSYGCDLLDVPVLLQPHEVDLTTPRPGSPCLLTNKEKVSKVNRIQQWQKSVRYAAINQAGISSDQHHCPLQCSVVAVLTHSTNNDAIPQSQRLPQDAKLLGDLIGQFPTRRDVTCRTTSVQHWNYFTSIFL